MQRVARWGNSLAIRIPAALARAADLSQGQEIAVEARDGELLIRAVRTERPRRHTFSELAKDMTADKRHELIDWGPPVGREAW